MAGEDNNGAERARADPAAAALALGAAALDPRAREYLEEQTRLTRLQIEDLKREDRLRHWSLVVRHTGDVMRLAFQFAAAFIVLAFAVFIAATVWSASHDNSLVIDSFSVPPDMEARGLTGQVVAAQLQDKLAAMQAATDSARPAESYSNNWGNDIKVQIPDTGVSVGEFYRYLSSWLGSQTHITGEVFRNQNGISVTARTGSDAAAISGSEADLDKLLQQAAEKIYERTQPYRYAIYLEDLGPSHSAEARKVLEALAGDSSVLERSWAFMGLATLDGLADNLPRAIAEFHEALTLDPDLALAYVNLDSNETSLGHDEASLDDERNVVRLLQGSSGGDVNGRARAIMLPIEQSNVAFALNDFSASIAYSREAERMPDYAGNVENGRESVILSLALMHDGAGVRQAIRDLPPAANEAVRSQRGGTEAIADYFLNDWVAEVAARKPGEALVAKTFSDEGWSAGFAKRIFARQEWPYTATAMAMLGDFKGAHALIDQTPLDCYTCVRNRANIDAAQKNWAGAAYWFAIATREAPSIPLGYSQWGKMLLAKGDYDAAIAKFTIANQKGPHFADPLEMWGEALMQKNRSGLAIAKFAEANNYAPNWGRLHLKWGQALLYTGDKAAAQKQFAIAAHLDLTPSEKSELAKVSHG